MIRTFQTFFVFAALVIFSAASNGQTLTTNRDAWADYVANDYDVLPNITYSIANKTDLKLDLYRPRNHSTPSPTLIFFHGGGWVAGQKERSVLFLLPYMSLGWAVMNVEYRMAQNSPAPAAVEDCRCALMWAVSHAKQFNLDDSKIVLTGTSAGGHLALITGMLPPGSIFDRQCPTNDSVRWTSSTEPAVHVAAIVNWYGLTDVADLLEGPNAKHYAIEWFGSLPHRQELAREVSPISYVRAGLPPIITIHGDEDELVPYTQAVRLHKGLDKAGVPNQLITIQGGKHGGFKHQEIVNCFETIREFLRRNDVLKPE